MKIIHVRRGKTNDEEKRYYFGVFVSSPCISGNNHCIPNISRLVRRVTIIGIRMSFNKRDLKLYFRSDKYALPDSEMEIDFIAPYSVLTVLV